MPNLVLCQAYLAGYHWPRELEKCGEKDVAVAVGTRKQKKAACLSASQWLVVSIDTFWRVPYIGILRRVMWDTIILDESFKIKSISSARSKGTRKLKTRKWILLSGVPMDKTPRDMYPQACLLDPGMAGHLDDWDRRFVKMRTWKREVPPDAMKELSLWRRQRLEPETDVAS